MAYPGRCFLTLATNGVALDLPLARELRKAGIRMLSLSLDSPDAREYERKRGVPGIHGKVMEALEIARQARLRVSVCTIVTKELLESGGVERILEEIRGKAQQLTLNLPYRVGGWVEEGERLQCEDLARFRKLVKRSGIRWEGSSNYFKEGCPAGGEKIYITPYGDVMPCACIHASYGNVREKPLKTLYSEMRKTPLFRKGTHAMCLVAEDPLFSGACLEKLNRLAREDPTGRGGRELLEKVDPKAFG